MSYDAIMAELPKLSVKQLRDIRAACDGHIRGRAADEPTDATFEMLVLGAIISALQGKLFINMQICRSSRMYPSFSEKLDGIQRWLSRSPCNRLQQQWIITKGLWYMIMDYTNRGILVDHTALMANIHRLPAYVNQQFPGYAENGHLHKIVRHGRGTERA